MTYGMTYEQFWYEDPWMTRAYAQAFLLKRKMQNEDAWIQGAYFANAMSAVLGSAFGKRKINYLEKPFELYGKTEQEKAAEIREERQKVINYLSGLKKAFDRKHTGVDQNGKPGNT